MARASRNMKTMVLGNGSALQTNMNEPYSASSALDDAPVDEELGESGPTWQASPTASMKRARKRRRKRRRRRNKDKSKKSKKRGKRRRRRRRKKDEQEEQEEARGEGGRGGEARRHENRTINIQGGGKEGGGTRRRSKKSR